MPSVVSRWHGAAVKYPLAASQRKLSSVHGVFAAFTVQTTVPTDVAIVTVAVPVVCRGVDGGGPGFLVPASEPDAG